MRAHLLGGLNLLVALDDSDYVTADGAGDLHEHQTDGTAADDGYRIADLNAGFMQSAEDAGQRLGHGGVFEADVGRNHQHVGFDDATRHADIFGIGTIVEEQILAEIFLMLGAVEAHLTGGGIQRYDAHAFFEAMNAGADFFDDPGEFVSEEGGRDDHAGVIAALVDLEVSAAGERDLDFDQDFALFHAGDGNFFDLQIFFAVEDGSRHFSIHFEFCTSGAKAPNEFRSQRGPKGPLFHLGVKTP